MNYQIPREEVRKDIEEKFARIFSDTSHDLPEEVVEYAVNDVFETSALAEDQGYYSNGDIGLACQRALLHFVGHPDY